VSTDSDEVMDIDNSIIRFDDTLQKSYVTATTVPDETPNVTLSFYRVHIRLGVIKSVRISLFKVEV